MEVPYDIKRELLFTLHPYTSALCDVNSEYRSLCNNKLFLRQLRKRWLFPDQDVPDDYPDLSYSQIATYALFYYPIPESIGKFNPTSLYYRASIVYNEEQSRPFFEHAINHNFQLGDIGYEGIKAMLLIADHFGHRALLRETYDRFILRLIPNDPVERERKVICMLCALLMEDKGKFLSAYQYYMEGQMGDEEELVSLQIINAIKYIYISNYDIVLLANLINNMLTWIAEVEVANTSALEDFHRGLSRTHSSIFAFDTFGYQLSLCMSDEELLNFVPSVKPLPKDPNISIDALADYWTFNSLENLDTIDVLAYRPDLLEEIELFTIPYINYVQADQYYYYLMYSDFISNIKPSVYGRNHLNVSGYNPDIAALAKHSNMAPEYYTN